MALKIGELFALISADDSDFNKKLDGAEAKFRKTGSSMTAAGVGLTAGVTAPLALMGKSALDAGRNFEEAMSGIEAVAGATGDELSQLRDLAIDMGAKTKYSALEAADGMAELVKAGVSVEDILGGGMQGALSLAAAGEIDLANAAEIASTVLNAFKKDGLDVKDAADLLSGAAVSSAASVHSLSMGLSAVSSVASGMGMTFADTNTALAVFAQNGLKGSDAGTSLKTMLMNLQPITDKQVNLFKKLNLLTEDGSSAFYDSAGNMKSLAQISGLLKTNLGDLTSAERALALETMFGSDAIRAGNVLFAEGEEGVNKMAAAINTINADDVAATKMNNLNGSLEELSGSVETMFIKLVSGMLPAMKEWADKATDLVNKFMLLDPETQNLVLSAVALVAALGPMLIITGQISNGIGALVGGVKLLAPALAFLTSPVGLVVAALAALTAGVVYLWNTNEGFREGVTAVWEWIKTTLVNAFNFIKDAAMVVWDGLVEFWKRHGQVIMDFFTALWNLVSTIFIEAWSVISESVSAAWRDIVKLAEPLWAPLKEFFVLFWGGLRVIIGGIWEAIQIQFSTFLKLFTDIFNIFAAVFRGDWEGAWNGIKKFFEDLWNGILDFLKNALKTASDFLNSILGKKNEAAAVKFDSPTPGLGGTRVTPTSNMYGVPKFANGGIVDRPTLGLIGEGAEKEAIMPLSKLDSMIGRSSGVTVGAVKVYTSSGDGAGIARDIREELSYELRKMAIV